MKLRMRDEEDAFFNVKPFVFLGGTCNNSTWRNTLISKLKINYFNPVVDNWSENDIAREELAKKYAAILLYVITPAISGLYAIAELTLSATIKEKHTVIAFLEADGELTFNEAQIKSINAIKNLIKNNTNAIVLDDLDEVAIYLNACSI